MCFSIKCNIGATVALPVASNETIVKANSGCSFRSTQHCDDIVLALVDFFSILQGCPPVNTLAKFPAKTQTIRKILS